MEYYGINNQRHAEIKHYGVLGMHWGVRRYQNYDGTLKNAGKQHYGTNSNYTSKKIDSESQNSTSSSKLKLTDGQKKALKIGASVVAGAAILGVSAYALRNSGIANDALLKGFSYIERATGLNKGSGDFLSDINEIAKAGNFKLNEKFQSIIDSTRKVNPGYSSGKAEYTNNCYSASIADICNRMNSGKGLNVTARAATSNELSSGGMSFNNVIRAFEDSSIDDVILKKDNIENGEKAKLNFCSQIIDKYGSDDAYGIFRVKSSSNGSVGHYMKWEIKNGEVYLSDSLSGSMQQVDKYFNAVSNGRISRALEISRLDGLNIDAEELLKIVESQ